MGMIENVLKRSTILYLISSLALVFLPCRDDFISLSLLALIDEYSLLHLFNSLEIVE